MNVDNTSDGVPWGDRPSLRADGNLSYLQFIATVKKLWEESHPGIKIVPTRSDKYAQYPCIAYALEDKQTTVNERKIKFREEIREESGRRYLIHGQWFMNSVSFTAISKNNPEQADQLIEAFEFFIMEYTPVFKQLGASEFLYMRRLSDREESRLGADTNSRTVIYSLRTEIILKTPVDVIEDIIRYIHIDGRTLLANNKPLEEQLEIEDPYIQATPTITIVDQHAATPLI